QASIGLRNAQSEQPLVAKVPEVVEREGSLAVVLCRARREALDREPAGTIDTFDLPRRQTEVHRRSQDTERDRVCGRRHTSTRRADRKGATAFLIAMSPRNVNKRRCPLT